jgi:hypothetical protein
MATAPVVKLCDFVYILVMTSRAKPLQFVGDARTRL